MLTTSQRPAVRPPRPVRARPKLGAELPAEVHTFLAGSRPGNQRYRVVDGQLVPNCQLWLRHRRIAALYPQPLTSLLDVSCAQGYFVLAAAQSPVCERAVGLDVEPRYIDVCRQVADHLDLPQARFATERFDKFAARLAGAGQTFQTVLLINTYQYLYFGSEQHPEHLDSHREIFAALRRLTWGRVIFNNRLELAQCQQHVQARAAASGRAASYHTRAIREAAAEFFAISEHGRLGRYPIWVLTPRERRGA